MTDDLDKSLADIARRLDDTLARRGAAPERERAAVRPAEAAEVLGQDKRLDRLLGWGVPYQEALIVVGAHPHRPFRDTQAVHEVREFLRLADDQRYNICVLAGSVGTGKTCAAVHFMELARPRMAFNRSWPAETRPRFHHASEILVMGLYDHEEERERLKTCRVLVIDDVGTERLDNAGVGNALFDWLFNARYGAAGLTVITTNTPWECKDEKIQTFKQRYGERVADRFKQQAFWVDLASASMREPVA